MSFIKENPLITFWLIIMVFWSVEDMHRDYLDRQYENECLQAKGEMVIITSESGWSSAYTCKLPDNPQPHDK